MGPHAKLRDYNWPLVATTLGAAYKKIDADTAALTLLDGRQVLVCENGGEFNTVVRETSGTSWTPGFSVGYWSDLHRDGSVRAMTLAYRIRCHVEDRQLDYQLDLDDGHGAEGIEAAVACSPIVALGYGREAVPCTCNPAKGQVGRYGNCLACRLARGPL